MDSAGQRVIWTPTPRQAEFLSAPDEEVLYGGAAGGGKSDSLVIDALGMSQGGYSKPEYSGLLLRRSFPELRELIDRSRDIYPQIIPGAKYSEQNKEWSFPSLVSKRPKVEFGYLESEVDRFRYQGRQFAYIGWDELTQYATNIAYSYLLSRNRCPDPSITSYCRSTTNPGGIGHEWVRDRWRIDDDGGPTRFCDDIIDPDTGETRRTWLRFVPAKLSDNPHLALNDPAYKTKLLRMSEMERRALLNGRWDVVEIQGAIYQKELEWLYLNQRIGSVPVVPGSPIYTFWDLGRSDLMAIWFMQRVGMCNRFFRYYQDLGKPIQHYAAELARLRDENKWIYGGHYLPHDIEVTDLSSEENKSRREILEESGIGEIHTVPRIEDVWEGINMTRTSFAGCWFDKEGCADGLKGMRNYRREYDEKNQVFKQRPLHNWASNPADAFRQFAQGFTGGAAGRDMNSWRKGRSRRGAMAV
jgi:hypothetical protein